MEEYIIHNELLEGHIVVNKPLSKYVKMHKQNV